jgi:hypothetical protein
MSASNHAAQIATRKSSRSVREDAWHRRQALRVAAQLPDNPREALTVLEHAETLVRSFLTASKA